MFEDTSHPGYFWLGYVLSNLLLSCRICNSSRKGTSFPIAAGAKRLTYTNRSKIRKERRLLLDPSSDPIEDLVRIDLDNDLFPILEKAPAPGSLTQNTINFFMLNADPRLVKARIEAINQWLEELDDGNEDVVRRAASRFQPHSLAARDLLLDVGLAIPTPNEELEWLTDSFIEELRVTLSLVAASTDSSLAERHAEELFWILAVLARVPPCGNANIAKRQLRRAGYFDLVEPYIRELE